MCIGQHEPRHPTAIPPSQDPPSNWYELVSTGQHVQEHRLQVGTRHQARCLNGQSQAELERECGAISLGVALKPMLRATVACPWQGMAHDAQAGCRGEALGHSSERGAFSVAPPSCPLLHVVLP